MQRRAHRFAGGAAALSLADKLDADLAAAANAKILLNPAKYPADKARGSMRRYTYL